MQFQCSCQTLTVSELLRNGKLRWYSERTINTQDKIQLKIRTIDTKMSNNLFVFMYNVKA